MTEFEDKNEEATDLQEHCPKVFQPDILPILNEGIVRLGPTASSAQALFLNGEPIEATGSIRVLRQIPCGSFTLALGDGGPHTFRTGGWSGRVAVRDNDRILGYALDESFGQDVVVAAFHENLVLCYAVARRLDGGAFVMTLPPAILFGPKRQIIIGIVGSDYILDGGRLVYGHPSHTAKARFRLRPQATRDRIIRIKISTPNLKEAPMWGDYHFACALRDELEALGQRVNVDTIDSWYARPEDQDVAIVLRGRTRYKVNPSQINLMWMISHPDRITPEELRDFDHIAVASDVYARYLRSQTGHDLPISVMHQATDARKFSAPESAALKSRVRQALFLGNSRREYRTMVKWCIKLALPLKLYGGGWDGIVRQDLVQGANVANNDLPALYASHLLLLNDHWESMRSNGFLSNRLFDGSATGTPILTDAVSGLSEVFGDTIAKAETLEEFEAQICDCLANPDLWLERAARARDIVLGQHTFAHRAAEILSLVERVDALHG